MSKTKPQPITPVAYERANGTYRITAGEHQYVRFVCETPDLTAAETIAKKLDLYVRIYNKHILENTSMDEVGHNMFMRICEDKMFCKQWAPGLSHLKWDANKKSIADIVNA